jgi:hypothetical protein
MIKVEMNQLNLTNVYESNANVNGNFALTLYTSHVGGGAG